MLDTILFLHLFTLTFVFCTVNVEMTREPNSVHGSGSGTEVMSTQPNLVYGLSMSGSSHEIDPATTTSATEDLM